MSEKSGLSQGVTLGFVSVAVAAIVAAGAYYSGFLTSAEQTPSEPLAVSQPENAGDGGETAQTMAAEPAISPSEAEAAQPDGEPEIMQSEQVGDETQDDLKPDPPTIDTFRLDPDGQMLVAGRTEPDRETSILLDGEDIRVVNPDDNGQFVEFVQVSPSDKARVLTLSMRGAEGEDAIRSAQEIIIAPTPRVSAGADTGALGVQSATSQGETETGAQNSTGARNSQEKSASDTANADDTKAAEDADVTAQSSDPEALVAQGSEATQAPTVFLSDESGVRVLQAPESQSDDPADGPAMMSAVALDAITYSDEGGVQISGRAESDSHVRIYLDNKPITTSPVSGGGSWRSNLPEVDTGVYTLRIDELDAEGNVTSRVETPLKRQGDIVLAEVSTAESGTQIAAVTVVPGSTLWAISRAAYGEGILYVRVFEANKDNIRDPDLIYPGQVFTIPQ